MGITVCFLLFVISATDVNITEPVDGETYNGDWLTVRAIVENENEIPEYVQYSLNGQPVEQISRLNTDWYTYMQNDQHHGYSESPAPTDNTILWAAPVTGYLHEFPTPVVVDGIVYYPQDYSGDSLYALNAATGELIWKYWTGYTDDAVTVKNGYLFTASDSLLCLDALTGDRIWGTSAAGWHGGTPAVVDGRVYCGQSEYYNSFIYCFDAATGAEIWSEMLSGFTASCMTVWNSMVFVPTFWSQEETPLYALDANTGSIIWENTDAYEGYWDSSPVVIDNLIYINGQDGKTRAIDAITGITVWEQPTGEATATIAYHEDRLYFASEGAPYYCLNALNGITNWTAPYDQHGSSGIADGLVFFGEFTPFGSPDSARIVALDCETGAEVWSYRTSCSDYGFQSSPSITDGVMYYACTDGYLYAFGTGLKYTYSEDYFYADVGPNELIVTSFDGGVAVAADTINFTVTQTGITLEPSSRLALCASPNPFHSSTSISFELSEPGYTSIEVFDLSGRMVSVLESAELTAGEHSIQWNGSSQNGEPVSAGLYFCRIQSGSITETTGLCLLR